MNKGLWLFVFLSALFGGYGFVSQSRQKTSTDFISTIYINSLHNDTTPGASPHPTPPEK